MEAIRILIALEPRMYREVLASAVRQLYPQAATTDVIPEAMDAEIRRSQPHVVFCTRATPAVEAHALTQIVLYPDNTSTTYVSSGRLTIVGTDIHLDELLAVIEYTASRLRACGAAQSEPEHAGGEG